MPCQNYTGNLEKKKKKCWVSFDFPRSLDSDSFYRRIFPQKWFALALQGEKYIYIYNLFIFPFCTLLMKACFKQFQKDFTLSLHSQPEELVVGKTNGADLAGYERSRPC